MQTAQIIDSTRARSKAAASMRRSAATPRDLAAARHRDRSTATRMMQGSGIAAHAIQLVTELARGDKTTPWPLIVAMKNEAMRALLEQRTDQWLIRRWHELQSRECTEEAQEELTSRGRDRAAYRAALLAEAETQIELSAVDEVLEQRGIEPRLFRGDGYPLAGR